VIYCETWKDRDVLLAMEEGLRYAELAAVAREVASRLSLFRLGNCNAGNTNA
jgi:hypothetical protein